MVAQADAGSLNDGGSRSWPKSSAILLCAASAVMVVVLFLVCWSAYRWSREAARLKMTRESFMVTGLAFESYDMLHHRLPFPVRHETIGTSTSPWMPDGTGKRLYSWRGETALLPDNWFLNGGGEWDPSAPWDSPANHQIADFPWRFCYDGLVTWDPLPTDYARETCQMAIIGPGTAFGGGLAPKRLREIDFDTILVVETRNSGVHWMQPGDFDIRTMPRTINAPDGRGISSRYSGGFHVLFADGEVWFISDRIPFQTLETFFTVKGAQENDREKSLAPFLLNRHLIPWRS